MNHNYDAHNRNHYRRTHANWHAFKTGATRVTDRLSDPPQGHRSWPRRALDELLLLSVFASISAAICVVVTLITYVLGWYR